MLNSDLILIGTGGLARTYLDTLYNHPYNIIGLIDHKFKKSNEDILGKNIIGNLEYIKKIKKKTNVVISIGDTYERNKIYLKLNQNKLLIFPSIINYNTYISKSAKVSKASFINYGAYIGPKVKIGTSVIVNTKSIIEHETSIGSFSNISPNVTIGGRVKIGKNVFVGIGSTIIDQVSIGNNVIIGAGTVITKNITSNSKVVGVNRKI